jgi:hypothetical protein
MKDLHHLTAFANKDVNIAICRVQSQLTNLPAQAVNPHSHIGGVLRHNDAIILIQVKHSFFATKLRRKKAMYVSFRKPQLGDGNKNAGCN